MATNSELNRFTVTFIGKNVSNDTIEMNVEKNELRYEDICHLIRRVDSRFYELRERNEEGEEVNCDFIYDINEALSRFDEVSMARPNNNHTLSECEEISGHGMQYLRYVKTHFNDK